VGKQFVHPLGKRTEMLGKQPRLERLEQALEYDERLQLRGVEPQTRQLVRSLVRVLQR